MKRLVACLAVTMVVLALAPRAGATESRSQSLLYNLAFEDDTDVFMFPHLLPAYEGLYLHLPANISNVYGGLIYNLDNNSAFGIYIHRPLITAFDQYRMVATDAGVAAANPLVLSLFPGNPGLAQEPHLAGQIFDIMYGARTWGIALRMHLFSDVSVQEGLLADPAEGTSAFTTELNAGFEVSRGFDMRASFAFRHENDLANTLRIRAGMRYLQPGNHRVRLVLASELTFGILMPDADGADNHFGLSLPFKVGARFTLIEDLLFVGLLGGLDIQMLKLGDEDMRFGVAIPTLEMAAELQATSWFHLRTAIKGGWGIQFAGPGDNTPKYEQMAFSSGVGFDFGPFSIDGVIQYQMWQNGPWLVGGVAGLFGGVTLAYQWGEDATAQMEDTAAAPAPRPVAKPAPKPAAKPAAKPAPKPAEKTEPAKKPEEKEGATFEGWED